MTFEEHLRQLLGDLAVQLAQVLAERDQLKERTAQLEGQLQGKTDPAR